MFCSRPRRPYLAVCLTFWAAPTAVAQSEAAYLRRGAFPLDPRTYPVHSMLKREEHPDLGVTHVERLPYYRAYQIDYTVGEAGSFRPTIKDGYDTKHWPDVGEQVTYVAHVRNHGGRPSGEFDVRWTLDGRPVHRQDAASLQPGVEKLFEWKTSWRGGSHAIGVAVDPHDDLDELATFNNVYQFDTLAINIVWVTTPLVRRELSAVRSKLGNFSYEDWIKYYFDYMNYQWATNRYPATPNGTRARIRIDRWVEVRDEQAWREILKRDGPVQAWGFDGAWKQLWTNQDFVGDKRPQTVGYVDRWDWGLPHELAHQCGLIDEYQLDIQAVYNHVSGPGGYPLKIGRTCRRINSMMHGHSDVPFSDIAIAALETQVGRRRGYYGDYMFALPRRVAVRLLDNHGEPAENVRLSFYQSGRGSQPRFPTEIDADAEIEGLTDAQGVFVLPNRPIGFEPYATDLGYEQHDNPFGPIDIVGRNAVMFVRLEQDEHVEYRWLEVFDLNIRYFAGQREETTLIWHTNVPHTGLPRPPTNLRVEPPPADGGAKLVWDARPDSSIIAYRVYRADADRARFGRGGPWPNFLTQTKRWDNTYVDRTAEPGRRYRYVVTAVDTSQNESGFSNHYVFGRLAQPGGLALIPPGVAPAFPGGGLVVTDHKQNQPLIARFDGQIMGPLTTVHSHLYPFDAAVSPDGLLVVTDLSDGYNGGHRLQLFGPRDNYIDPVVYMTRDVRAPSSQPGQLNEPRGVCFSPDGTIWVADTGNNRLQQFSVQYEEAVSVQHDEADSIQHDEPDGKPSRPRPKALKLQRIVDSDTPMKNVQETGGAFAMQHPVSVACDTQGRLIVCDDALRQVFVLAFDSETATLHLSLTDLIKPTHVAAGPGGHIFVSDAGERTIRVYTSTGRPFARFSIARGGVPGGLAVRGEQVYVVDTQRGVVTSMCWRP